MNLRYALAVGAIVALITLVGSGANRERGVPRELELRTPIYQLDLPLTISRAGTYYIAEDLRGLIECVPCEIVIDVPRVRLDLNQFLLDGVRIRAAEGRGDFATIENGMIQEVSGVCVDLADAEFARISDLFVSNCRSAGIRVGRSAVIDNVTVKGADGTAIEAGFRSELMNSRAFSNGNGVALGDSSTVRNTTVLSSNSQGFILGSRSTAVGCSSRGNFTGFAALGNEISIRDSQVSGNRIGVQVDGRGVHVERNSLASNDVGILVDEAGFGNRIAWNSFFNVDTAIQVDGTNNLIIGNVASGTSEADFAIATGNEVGPVSPAASATSPWANIGR